jgi:hypothetical protein
MIIFIFLRISAKSYLKAIKEYIIVNGFSKRRLKSCLSKLI